MDEPIAEITPLSQRGAAALRGFWHGFVDWLTPPKCLFCGDDVSVGAGLCPACWQKLHFIDEPVCEALGLPFEYDQGEGALSPQAIADPPSWNRARAAVAFDESSRQLVYLLKYRDRQEAGLAMARMMLGPGRKLLQDCDVIVPVPLHSLRLWRRRFNQAAFLARALAERAGRPCALETLMRHKATRPQVGLTAQERAKNVRRAFAVDADRRATIDGKSVLLVDDVRTTGATAGACAEALKEAGARQVDVLSFALVLEPARLHIDA